MATIEDLHRHRDKLRGDLEALNLEFYPDIGTITGNPTAIWESVCKSVRSTKDAMLPPKEANRTAIREMIRTDFARRVFDALATTPDGFFQGNDTGLGACAEAELKFLAAAKPEIIDRRKKQPVVILEHEGSPVGILKRVGEQSILGLAEAPGLNEGIISGFSYSNTIARGKTVLAAADRASRTHYGSTLKAVAISLKDVEFFVGAPRPIRGSTFGLDRDIIDDFNDCRPFGRRIVGLDEMKNLAERLVGKYIQAQRTRRAGEIALDILGEYVSELDLRY